MDSFNGQKIGPNLNPQEKVNSLKQMREMLFLAEQAGESNLKILPSKNWSLHYPVNLEVRNEKLQGLLDGKYSAEEVANDIKPDSLIMILVILGKKD